MKPETSVRKKVQALERKKAMLDALIAFIKAHPDVAQDSIIQPLYNAKVGLFFPEWAMICPYWVKDKVVLRLQKSGADWYNHDGIEMFDRPEKDKVVAEDVTDMSDEELDKLLDRMLREIEPDYDKE